MYFRVYRKYGKDMIVIFDTDLNKIINAFQTEDYFEISYYKVMFH